MRILVLIFVFFMLRINFAQENAQSLVVSTQKLAGGNGLVFKSPRWSPDGSKIAITGPNYKGLYVLNSNGTGLSQISDEMSAGYNINWSPNSRFISVTIARDDGGKRKNAVKIFDLELGISRLVTDFEKPAAFRLHPFDNSNNPVVSKAGAFKSIKINKEETHQTKVSEANANLICLIEGTNFSLYDLQTGVVNKMNPVPGAIYLTPVLSPDQKYVVFKIYGGDMQMLNIKTKDTINLGSGYHPCWSANSQWIVFERNTDNGHEIISAGIYLVDRNAQNERLLLDSPDALEVNPDWSPVTNEIVYENLKTGEINKLILKELPW